MGMAEEFERKAKSLSMYGTVDELFIFCVGKWKELSIRIDDLEAEYRELTNFHKQPSPTEEEWQRARRIGSELEKLEREKQVAAWCVEFSINTLSAR